jgi:dethiobiotin synthetase
VRPRRVVAVVGTGTDIGKTWVAARLLTELRIAGLPVAARKPAQSFDPDDDPASLDAAVLGAASNEPPEQVCPRHRWYEVPMAPPMAAEALVRPSFTIQDLMSELQWPEHAAADADADANADAANDAAHAANPVEVGLVETAGGLRSPLAADGDCLALCEAIAPDVVLLVADAGLGTINAVRLTLHALRPLPSSVIVVLNRYDPALDLHVRNRQWLQARDGLTVVTVPGGEAELAALVSA